MSSLVDAPNPPYLYHSWSPDSTRIAYTADHGVVGRNELYVVDVSSAQPSAAVRVNAALVSGGAVLSHRWTADSTALAYLADQDIDGVPELYIVDMSGPAPGAPQKVHTDLSSGWVMPRFKFSPDGSRLAYIVDDLGVQQLYVATVSMGTAGPAMRVNGDLVAGADVHHLFEWSPDSRFLAYRADQDVLNQDNLYIVDVSGLSVGPPMRVNGPMVAGGDVVFGGFKWAP